MNGQNWALLVPEYILIGSAFLVLGVDMVLPVSKQRWLGWFAVLGLGAAGAAALFYRFDHVETLFGGLFIVDGFSLFFFVLLAAIGLGVATFSIDFVKNHLAHPGEYYALLLLSVLGMIGMASAGELLTAYVSLELLSFSLYVMVALDRRNPRSNEAGVKYILLGALSSAILLYGISMVWGAVGETQYASIASVLSSGSEADPTLVAGLALILAGLGFKIAAVPFHMWAPDVYEGAPTPVTAYLAIGSKAAAFALVLRLFGQGLLPVFEDWRIVLAVMAAGTMVLGNLGAIVQRNIKRLLAYASIGQVGYLLLGVAALAYLKDGVPTPSLLASNGVMLHLVGYAIANLAVFTVVGTVYSHLGTDEPAAYAGLAKRSPYLALVMASALFSLAGLPFFVGFVTKFYLFTAAAQSGLLWLAGLAIASSVVSLYYYLVIVRRMYVEDSEDLDMVPFAISIPRVSWVLLGILWLGTILLGIYPGPLLDGINAASAALLA